MGTENLNNGSTVDLSGQWLNYVVKPLLVLQDKTNKFPNLAYMGVGSFGTGLENQPEGNYSNCFGHKNTVNAEYATSFGFDNTVTGAYSFVNGIGNNITHPYCFVHGNNLASSAEGQILFGKHSDIDENVKFCIGVGDDSKLKNAFTVKKNSSNEYYAEVETQGDTSNSVVIKRTFDKLIYDVLATKDARVVGVDVVDHEVEEKLRQWWDAMPTYSVRFFIIWDNGSSFLGGGANLVRMFKVGDTNASNGMIETSSYQNSVTGSGLRRRVIRNVFNEWEHFGNFCVDTGHVATNYVVAPKSEATTDDKNNDPDIKGSSLKQKSVLKLLTTHSTPSSVDNHQVGVAIKTALYYPDNSESETSMKCCVIPHYGNSWGSMHLGTSAHPWSSLFVSNVIPAKSRRHPDGTTETVAGGANLGTSSNGWDTIYTTNGSVQSSSRKSKENIKNVISETTPMTMDLRDDPVELSDITAEQLVEFVRNLQPVTFNYKGDTSQEAEQLGLIADDIAEHPVFKYVGIDKTENVEVTPAEYGEDGNVVTEAVTQEKRVLGLQALPLATVALSVCKHLINKVDYLEELLNEK